MIFLWPGTSRQLSIIYKTDYHSLSSHHSLKGLLYGLHSDTLTFPNDTYDHQIDINSISICHTVVADQYLAIWSWSSSYLSHNGHSTHPTSPLWRLQPGCCKSQLHPPCYTLINRNGILVFLTHWGQVMHINGSNNGLSSVWCQAIIRSNAGLLLIGLIGTNFSEIVIKTQQFSLKKINFTMVYAKWPFCLSLNVLTHWGRVTYICVGNLTIIGSENGLSPARRQAIIWTNAGILLIGPLGTNFNEIIIEI